MQSSLGLLKDSRSTDSPSCPNRQQLSQSAIHHLSDLIGYEKRNRGLKLPRKHSEPAKKLFITLGYRCIIFSPRAAVTDWNKEREPQPTFNKQPSGIRNPFDDKSLCKEQRCYFNSCLACKNFWVWNCEGKQPRNASNAKPLTLKGGNLLLKSLSRLHLKYSRFLKPSTFVVQRAKV